MKIFELPSVRRLLRTALDEDLGRGDLTTGLVVPPSTRAHGEIIAKQGGIVAGLPILSRLFQITGGTDVEVNLCFEDGARFASSDRLAVIDGSASDLLSVERVALNFLQHLSGVATLTGQFVDAVRGTRARIVDTRKTTPGLRALEKYAVRMGGGHNHRLGLDDGILIKDNHLAAGGGIAATVARARERAPHTVKIEVECTDLAEVEEAIAAGADTILLDNMTPQQMTAATQVIAGRTLVEASGGVTLNTVRAVAKTGVDLISVGALTHSPPVVDLSMRLTLM